jgi:hypothetical protein
MLNEMLSLAAAAACGAMPAKAMAIATATVKNGLSIELLLKFPYLFRIVFGFHPHRFTDKAQRPSAGLSPSWARRVLVVLGAG